MNIEEDTKSPIDNQIPIPRNCQKRRWIVIIIVFILGMFFGGALTVGIVIKCLQHAVKHPEEMPARITARLTRKLDLSDDQREKVEAILEEGQASLMAIRVEVNPRVKAELDHIGKEIGEVMTDQQRAEWQQLYQELRNKWAPVIPKASVENISDNENIDQGD